MTENIIDGNPYPLRDLAQQLIYKIEGVRPESEGDIVVPCPIEGHDTFISMVARRGADAIWCEDERCEPAAVEAALRVMVDVLPRLCPKRFEHRYSEADRCLRCMIYKARARDLPARIQAAAVSADARVRWGRVDLLNVPPPEPPTVGRVTDDIYLFTRGRRHVIYGDGETGKSWILYLSAGSEVTAGNAAVIFNGEMDPSDVRDWVLDHSWPQPSERDVAEGLFVYPSAGLLTDEQRRRILSDVAASGRALTLVGGDSTTSLLSEAGLNPNNSEDIEKLARELGLWATRHPDHPAFVLIDHLSKGSESSSPTGSIRKRNVADVVFKVENVKPFSPKTQWSDAASGYSTVKVDKGRRGGRGHNAARVVGHDSRVRLMGPRGPLPWNDGKLADTSGVADETLTILRKIAEGGDLGMQELVDALPFGQSNGFTLVKGICVDEEDETPSTLIVRRKVGRSRVPTLTERGHQVLAEASSTATTPKE